MEKRKVPGPHGEKCGAHGRQRGQPCAKSAGWGTAHVGVGRCRLHGGLKKTDRRGRGDRRMKHGLRSKALSMYATLQQQIRDWKERDAPRATELLGELEQLRALARHYLDRPEKGFDVESYLKIHERIARAIDVQRRAEQRGMVSLETVQDYLEKFGRIISLHVKDYKILTRIEDDAHEIPLLTAGQQEYRMQPAEEAVGTTEESTHD